MKPLKEICLCILQGQEDNNFMTNNFIINIVPRSILDRFYSVARTSMQNYCPE